jgi:hypothetical protein
MKFDDLATAERPGHAARAQTVIVFGDRGQHEALIPRARYGHSLLCRKRPKSDLLQNVLLRIRSLAVGEARRGEGDDKHLQAESRYSSQMQLHDCDRRIFDAVRQLIPDG